MDLSARPRRSAESPTAMKYLSKYISLTALGLLVILSLAGCASSPKLEVPQPQLSWTTRTVEPVIMVKTNGQMAQTLQKFKHALEQCNLDKDTIRVYIEQVSQPKVKID